VEASKNRLTWVRPAQRGALLVDLPVELDIFLGEVEAGPVISAAEKALDSQQVAGDRGRRSIFDTGVIKNQSYRQRSKRGQGRIGGLRVIPRVLSHFRHAPALLPDIPRLPFVNCKEQRRGWPEQVRAMTAEGDGP